MSRHQEIVTPHTSMFAPALVNAGDLADGAGRYDYIDR
jgi:hypothetical protein